jgi:DNA topoisomerase-1
MIDVLALRVGNEKGEDEAETYGACSLLVEHVTLTAPASLKLSFLGKDSMPYENTVQAPPLVYRNIAQFVAGKRADESLFDTLTTSALNKHLKSYMDGLTAKCFRTYNASVTLERQLAAAVVPDDATNEDKLLIYNAANRAVAILCNHQRTVSKTFDESMQRSQAQLDYVLAEKKYVQKMREYYKTGAGQEPKPPKPLKDDAKPIAAPKDVAACNKRIDAIDAKLKKMNFERSEREENKTIALSTSKLNYMDPRITAAFCKRVGLPIEKVFAKTLRQKFPWALDVEPDWKFFDESLPADANITFDGEVINNNKKSTTTTKRTKSSSTTTTTTTTKKHATKKKKEESEEEEESESEEDSDDDESESAESSIESD